MTRKWTKEYPLEAELNKLLKELRVLVRKAGDFFFVIPKNKMDKYIYIMETISWLLLTIVVFWRILGR